MPAPLEEGKHRRCCVRGYFTPEQKADATRLAQAVGMTESDLTRLFYVTASPDDVERLKTHPAYLALLMEESSR
jgi:hypothetical protein